MLIEVHTILFNEIVYDFQFVQFRLLIIIFLTILILPHRVNIFKFLKVHFLGILDSSKDDFEDADEVYEAIGEVLHEVEQKSENEVR